MAKEICPNCNAKLSERVSFCPVCSRPTRHATEAELLEWDLRQWRGHVERSVASGSVGGAVGLKAAAARPQRAPAPDLQVVVSPDPVAGPAAKEKRRSRRPKLPKLSKPRLGMPAQRSSEDGERVIVLDADNPFAYTACTSCERTDWIVRYGRNEDRTYNYWCVRCSRSFKSDARLGQALKPFLASGSVIGALTALAILMR